MSSARFLFMLLLLLFFVASSEAGVLLSPSLVTSFDTTSRNHHHRRHFNSRRYSCRSLPYRTSRSLSIYCQIMNQQRRLRASPTQSTQVVVMPSPTGDHEIDPRYGVEKRLVPSGPNPLHN
ncbi:hypothetical protein K2173_021941 [Erythroxylum novogranatense]|uniref:CLAVATA3/ESR (CLE)-related protein 9 n=1 Tax=Erythroxylum novogranatense TaxID=1862640 RepID=A0AAV8T2X5_9ROSI|nr:hypothetical protein K2173_021941 [Erythroxylum novogranatense]